LDRRLVSETWKLRRRLKHWQHPDFIINQQPGERVRCSVCKTKEKGDNDVYGILKIPIVLKSTIQQSQKKLNELIIALIHPIDECKAMHKTRSQEEKNPIETHPNHPLIHPIAVNSVRKENFRAL